MFGCVNALMKGFHRVLIQNGHGLLADDGTGIHAGVDEVHGAAGHLHACVERLFPGFQTGKSGQERGVDIDDAPFEGAQKITFEHAHEAGEDNQVHLRLAQRLDVGVLGFFIQLGAEFSRGNKSRGEIPRTRMTENTRGFDVTQNERNARRDFSRRAGIGNGDEVRAFARTEHPDAEHFLIRHALYLQAGSMEEQAFRIYDTQFSIYERQVQVVYRRFGKEGDRRGTPALRL